MYVADHWSRVIRVVGAQQSCTYHTGAQQSYTYHTSAQLVTVFRNGGHIGRVMQKISRIVAPAKSTGTLKKWPPRDQVLSLRARFGSRATLLARTERNVGQRRRPWKEKERVRSSRRRRSAPFDLACNPVGPRGLTDVMRGVRGPCVRDDPPKSAVCALHALVDMSLRALRAIGIPPSRREGDVNLADLMNDETGLLWRHQKTADGDDGGVRLFELCRGN